MSKYYYKETFKNAKKYYEGVRHNYVAQIFNGQGFTSRIDMDDKMYFVITRIDKDSELVILEIFPSIHCINSDAIELVSSYISKINPIYKCCSFQVTQSGSVFVKAEQHFKDGPIAESLFADLEFQLIKLLDTFEVPLHKLSCIKLLSPEESDVHKMIEKHNQKIKKIISSVRDDIFDIPVFDEDYDDDDDCSENDEDKEVFSVSPDFPDFIELLRRKKALNELLKNKENTPATDTSTTDGEPTYTELFSLDDINKVSDDTEEIVIEEEVQEDPNT